LVMTPSTLSIKGRFFNYLLEIKNKSVLSRCAHCSGAHPRFGPAATFRQH
jgi:hypothetical protein